MENFEISYWIMPIVFLIAAVVVTVLLTRYIFGTIGKQLKYQETIINILTEIALNQGVPPEKVNRHIDAARNA
jgi:hypothetical protein